MKSKVWIDSSIFTGEDIYSLNSEKRNTKIEFEQIKVLHYHSDSFLIMLLIQLGQNIGFNAAYDLLKYIFNQLFLLLSKKPQSITEHVTRINVVLGEKTYSISCNFPLTQKQKDKLIDAAIKKLLQENE